MKIYNKIKIQLTELYNSAFNYFTQKYQTDNKKFSMASAWGQLLQTQHELAKLNLYYIEDAVTELNATTALKKDSIYGLSTLTGHSPFLGNAANGILMLYRNGNEGKFKTKNLVIPNNTKLLCVNNGLTYSLKLDSDYILLNNDFIGIIDLKVYQGKLETQEVTGTGEDLQTFNFTLENNLYFDHDEIDVFVNNEKWNKVNSLLEMSYNSKEFYINASITGGITLYFGNENLGGIPPLGAIIKINYIKHNGVNGNILANNSIFKFSDTLYDTFGNEVEINKLFNIGIKNVLSFGADSESLELTKRLFNRIDRSNILYTTTSFEIFLSKFDLFSTIRVFKKLNDNILQDDNIIYIILIPDTLKRVGNTLNYYTIPLEYFKVTKNEKIRISEMIEKTGRKPSQLEINIIDPKIKRYILNLNIITYPDFKTQTITIKENIKEVIANYFLYNKRYDRIPKSDIIRIIENVPGVDSISAYFVGEENEKNKINNPTTTELIGLDSFNDIVLQQDEIAILRGGWTDSNNIKYSNNILDEISMLNIIFK